MAKTIIFDKEAQGALKNGVNIIANAVGSTLGPGGRTVIISHHHLSPPFVTKDGARTCDSITLDDDIENIGVLLIREASMKTLDDCGDGTTTTCVIAQSVINEGLKQLSAGSNPQELKSGIEKAVESVCGTLKLLSTPVADDNDKIRSIATVSANNDPVIGKLIADAYLKIGAGGLLLIEESGTLYTTIDVVEGAEVNRGYISPEFANDKDKMVFRGNDAYVLVTDYELTSVMKDLAPIFSQMEQAGIITRPILIIAKNFDGEVFGSILKNVKQKTLNVCLAMVPNQYRVETLEDIAVLTGATVISDREGLKMANVLIEHLGRAEKIIASENTTTVIGGSGDKKKIEEHKNAIKIQMEDIKDEQLKEVWRKRLGMLSGSIGQIKVGGSTELEVKERFDRVDDAKRAVESAIEEGVVVGGGTALIRCIDKLTNLDLFGDEKIGRDIIAKACKSPLLKMLENAGEDTSIVKEVYLSKEQNFGYNIKVKAFQNLVEGGIIDPTKVVRSALQNAASVACGVLTSGCLIVEKKNRP